MQIRLGCSGWSYESWRDGVFYPPRLASGNRLRHYATRFDTVELNASFYRLPTRAAAQHWAEQTSDDFRFAVKVSRYLTHTVRLNDTARHLGLLLQRIEPLRGKLGPLLWQLPPTFKRDDDRLARALDELPAQLRHAFEFRHPSWFVDDVFSLLRDHQVAVVIADRPDLGPLQTDRADRGLRLRPLPPRLPRTARQLLAKRARRLGGEDPPLGARARGLGVLQQRLGRLRAEERRSATAAPLMEAC